ncbi:MAG: acyl carrier protein [Nitrospiraceae bacterium]|nr:acyl carrier protein [Nitrospiraceae bacterium]
MNPFQWFMENLAKMPAWVRVTTWFVLLFLTCYFYLAPRFVNGHAVVRLENGGAIDYRGATIRMHVEGRVLKFKSNEDGYWSVPVVSRIPQDMKLEIYHEDKQAWYEATVPGTEIWKNIFGTVDVKLVVNGGDKPVMLEYGRSSEPGLFVRIGRAVLSGFVSPAYGQTHQSHEAVAAATREIAARALKKPVADVNLNTKLIGKDAPSYTKKLQLIQQMELEFKIKVPDEEWRQMATLGDLVEYVFQNQR